MNNSGYGKLIGKYIAQAHRDKVLEGLDADFSKIMVNCGEIVPLLENFERVDSSLTRIIRENVSPTDYEWFETVNDIQIPKEVVERKQPKFFHTLSEQFFQDDNQLLPQKDQVAFKGLNAVHPRVMAWKNAEDNCVEFEKSMGNQAQNISKQNLGYDVESITPDGTNRKIDVKRLSRKGAPFTLTNNEYTAAMQFGKNYHLCLVYETKDKITFSYINNPLKNAQFVKQVQQWCWFSDEYLATDFDYLL